LESKKLAAIQANIMVFPKPKEAPMSEMILVGPIIVFTILTPIVLVTILSRFLRARENVPLEH